MDKQKIKFTTDTITDKDDLELGKSFQEMVKETVKHAFKEGIKANSIIINKDFIRVKKAWINNGFSYSELPDMICGLEVYLTDGDLPENYSFAVLERDKTERELLIERTRKETAEKFAERLKEVEEALLDMVVQFCQMGEEGYLKHIFMSAEEQAFDVLDIDYGEKVDDVYERFNKKWNRPIDEICDEITEGKE